MTACDSLVTYPSVLLLANQSYAQVDVATAESTKLFGVFVPPACRKAALRLSCLGGFVGCQFDPGSNTFAYFPPCRSVCEEMATACSAFLESQDQADLVPDCSTLPTVNCNDASPDTVVPYSQADCPHPLKFNPHGSVADPSVSLTADEQICVYPCPDPMFDASDWRASEGISISLGILSFSMILFLIVTYSLNPRKRRFPTSYQLWLCVSSIICTTGIDLAVLVGGPERTYCTWDDTPVLQSFDGARDNDGQGVVCVLQGMMVMYGGLAGSFWWVMLTFTVFQFIVIQLSSDGVKKALHIASHVVGWGMPAFFVTIALGAQQFDGQVGSHNCFVSRPWDWGIFYAPVFVNLCVGTTLMTIVIIKVLRIRSQLKEQTHISMEQVIRLSLLILGYWLVYAYVIGYRIYLEAVRSSIEDAVEDQIACSAATGDECPLSVGINKGAWYWEAFAVGGQGIIIFCCLGLSKETFTFWRVLFENWRRPMSVIKHGVRSHQPHTVVHFISQPQQLTLHVR
ncbi:Gprotein-coupled receptor [Acanthamoeba castellanii str. Neff]|uniref:Gprotein-coupled receptor n=1 Tax=Acanthamoeba castellanii (strain ATCC 30010 / Neff) TaxID=1257118 RepID=L8HDQ8_ACACF|nr:Gprotein-coupled receptor [Acanthamoeba castellanii str. Neff]ELR23372.1 Gprotein-coupled receptor [Acanthamoeba castellanii str. Neff]